MGFVRCVVPRIYLDNAATSFPKPPEVFEAMLRYGTQVGASPGRGLYAESREGAAIIRTCRERLAKFIGNPNPSNIVFALNTSDALNLAIKGVVRAELLRARRASREARIRLVTTAMDHNSVLRPFAALAEEGAEVVHVPCDPNTGLVDLDAWRDALEPSSSARAIGGARASDHPTTLAAINWVSNVTGTIQPIAQAVTIAKQLGVPTLVDAAQGLGHLPFDQSAIAADLVAFPGHKGLLGPQGTGGLSIAPGFEDRLATTREGGTGSIAELDAQPTTMPEKFEAGSHNTIGIAGLSEAVAWLQRRGMQAERTHELTLINRTLEGLRELGAFEPNSPLRLLGPTNPTLRVGTFSFVHDTLAPSEMAAILESEFGILSRAGIHCAPLAHQTVGTIRPGEEVFARGATRVSYGPFVTLDDVNTLLAALNEIQEPSGASRRDV